MTTEAPRYVTIYRAAAELSVHPDTIRRRVKSGELAAVRIGENGPIRIPVDELRDLLRPITRAA